LEISNGYDANMEEFYCILHLMEIDFVVVVDVALWFISEYPQFLR